MKRVMVIGANGAGKRTLVGALTSSQFRRMRTMAVEYYDQFIIPPGEFLENRRFYPAWITTSVDCDVLAFVQDATSKRSAFPPLFRSAFTFAAVGVISHIYKDSAYTHRLERVLQASGLSLFFHLITLDGQGYAKFT